jgi:hypothetical protein
VLVFHPSAPEAQTITSVGSNTSTADTGSIPKRRTYAMMPIGRSLLALLSLSAVAITPSNANAAAWCVGTLSNLFVDVQGNVTALPSWRSDYVRFCNLKVDFREVTPDICKSWYATMLAAQLSKRQTTSYYPKADSCTTVPTYGSSPAPAYFMLME